jgi:hypothetical protein
MQKPRNALDDCLRILAGSSSIAGIYVLYRLFELTGSTLTTQDIRLLLTLSMTILILAVALIFAYLVLFLYERLLYVFQQFKKIKNPDGLTPQTERLSHLELTMISALERIENRLALLEGRIGEEHVFPVSYEIDPHELRSSNF